MRQGCKYTFYFKKCRRFLACLQCALLCCAAFAENEVSVADPGLEAAIRTELNQPDGPLLDTALAGITMLIAENRSIVSLTGIELCVNLRTLKLHATGPLDLSPLQSIASLNSLEILDIPIAGISGLDTLDQLAALTLSRTGISDLSPLSGLLNLGNLNLSDNAISNLEPLASLTGLRILNLSHNQVEDISSLSGLTELVDLDISNNRIENISPAASLTKLAWLRVAHNLISDLSALANLFELRELYLDDNAITSIAGLPIPSELEYAWLSILSLNNNSISDIARMEHMRGLHVVELDDNEVCDLSPLVANQEFEVYDWSCYCEEPVELCVEGVQCVSRPTLHVSGNPLNEEACSSQVLALRNRNVLVKTGTSCDFGGTTCGLPSSPERRATDLLDTFHQLDADGDGQLHPEEFEPAIAPEVFTSEDAAAWDANGDGNLSIAELRQASRQHVAIHAADFNGNGILELPELLRAIQLFNAGGIACADAFDTEDGYASGDGNHDCFPHSSDFAEQDWSIRLSELLRAIQLYNMGAYTRCNTSEDGYCATPNISMG